MWLGKNGAGLFVIRVWELRVEVVSLYTLRGVSNCRGGVLSEVFVDPVMFLTRVASLSSCI